VLTTITLSVLLFSFFLNRAGASRLLRHPRGPVLAGPAIGLVFLSACLIWLYLTKSAGTAVIGIIIASFVMLVSGMFDDWKEQSVAVKLILQFLAAGILYFCGVKVEIAGAGLVLNALLSFVWVIGITNAINHLDIADGLAGGVVLMISAALGTVALLNGDPLMGFFSFVCASICAAFLCFNLPPAKLYLGNAGSHFFGFLLAAIALGIHYAPMDRRIALLSPVFIFGFPVFDTVFVSLMRIKKGKSALLKSDDHLAMRFKAMGLSQRRTLALMLGLAAFFSASGLVLSKTPNMAGVLVIAVNALVAFAVALKMNSEDGQ
jgi:UDP-GlcNAc:undecaprenyl-phosphate GlcNAc-1-phosphate transferase